MLDKYIIVQKIIKGLSNNKLKLILFLREDYKLELSSSTCRDIV